MSSPNDISRVHDAVAALPLIDHHAHGTLRETPEREDFELFITEGSHPAADGQTHFDSQVGFAIRRWCAPILDLPAWPSPEDYLARRADLGEAEVSRRMLEASGVGRLLFDTGYSAGQILSPAEMTNLTGLPTHEIVRLEEVLESTAGCSAEQIWTDFAGILADRTASAVGLKSIIAYRYGFDFAPQRPSRREVVTAAGRWLARVEATGSTRIEDPDLLRFALWAGVDRGLPIQLHTGYGDADLDLHRCNPTLLSEFFRQTAGTDASFTLLHCYPYQREAGYLAQVFPSVYFDVGLGVHYTGARSVSVIAESFELAPFHKILFSSDGWGPAELHFLGAHLWRRGMAKVFSGFVEDGDWSAAESIRVLTMVGCENAMRLYRVGASV
ncbi:MULTISPECIES: amidohydrolase family protein [unclassified Mycolicibacterium]|uniref:amidohydrolase family protein n=1 Tax=unclassified Mycolicibacterium TaxID=2636767 RepID=UPI0012DC56C6|nr:MULTISPECIES: amidohydrolase family protein [unclassified Mycolicibacterium]MUL84741.1 amidohydrolase family protein [Mycolicibacterium sp. CBMA 329]MUL88516.1 amidohydrolase family protein [Mycolicibacterium sp. CBMA 331]MUM00145.1 amidohydrolase family protein [Mycolicibacterium sp. CBMA 334]MUM27809.1 amidohydrolase family protein [Mycolicibacterium sp. CBMA 295]MUM40163.1 amidohydrolase family protein [Mycolicibacterium sp. CBMA 247]